MQPTVVVQGRLRNVQKKRDARAELLFWSDKPVKAGLGRGGKGERRGGGGLV